MMCFKRMSHSGVHLVIQAARLLMARSRSKRAKRAPYSNSMSTFAAKGWSSPPPFSFTSPATPLKQGDRFGLSGSLGHGFVELVRKRFLAPRAVDRLAASRGRVASWPVVLPTLRWERRWHDFQLNARWYETFVKLYAGSQEGFHVVGDGSYPSAIRRFVSP